MPFCIVSTLSLCRPLRSRLQGTRRFAGTRSSPHEAAITKYHSNHMRSRRCDRPRLVRICTHSERFHRVPLRLELRTCDVFASFCPSHLLIIMEKGNRDPLLFHDRDNIRFNDIDQASGPPFLTNARTWSPIQLHPHDYRFLNAADRHNPTSSNPPSGYPRYQLPPKTRHRHPSAFGTPSLNVKVRVLGDSPSWPSPSNCK